jgi:peptidyl-prolyl cis-trans isomerase D
MPEKLNIEYIVFNKKILKKQLSINSEMLKNYYNENKFKYITPEKRKVKQIFLSNIKHNKEKNAELIKEIHKKLENKSLFESLATKYSHDKLSNKKQGSIGWINRNDLSKDISDEVFKIDNTNDISNIIQTDQGFYIFKVEKIKEAQIKEFKDVKKTVKKDYENILVTRKYNVIFEEVSNILYENPSSLSEAEIFLSVNKKTTGLSTLSKIKKDHKVLNNEKILKEISSTGVYKEGLNSQPIEVGENIIMLRLKNKSPIKYKKYENVASEVEALINTEKSIVTMKDTIKNIEKKLNSGSTIKDIEKLTNRKSTNYSNIERSDKNIPPSLLVKLFSLTEKNNITSVESGTGNYELIVLEKINEGTSDLSEKSLKTMFNNEHVNSVLYSVIQSLREQSDIKIYPKNL